MKTFTLLITLLLFSLGVSYGAGPTTGDCGCSDSDNELKNGSFESGTSDWSKTDGTNFTTDDKYNVCGDKNGLIIGSGTVYQEVNLTPGSNVSVTVYGGTHDLSKTHKFYLTFYNSSGQTIDGSHNVEVNMDYKVTELHKLKQFSLSSTAPAGAAKVRLSAYSGGDYFKIDVACMSITTQPPSTCTACSDAETLLKNPSFESGTANWSTTDGTIFSTISKSYACGTNVGKIDGDGAVYQAVSLVAGSAVSMTVYGGASNTSYTHQFLLFFYNSSNQVIAGAHNITVNVNHNVLDGLEQYSLSATAPAGAVKVIFAAYSNGSRFYFDAACMSIVPPSQCETCNNNKLANAGFEDGANSWNSEGNFAATTDSKNCGEKGGKLIGAGKFWQDVTLDPTWGSQVTLTIWGAKDDNGGQKFQLFFYDASNKELGKIEKDITKIWGATPVGMEKYTLAGSIPAGTKTIRIQGSATSGVLRADGACLTFSGSPLPVTLATFDVNKEGSTASLRWATSYESNADHFDVQHSRDGKNWANLATIQAHGESKGLISYSYTHISPFSVNLYRLKMVDLDGTFAYSSIRSLNFNGDEDMRIYPNPTSDRIRLTGNQQVDNVKIYNQNGILVMDTLPDPYNEVNLSKLVQGTYYVKVNNGPMVHKILVVR